MGRDITYNIGSGRQRKENKGKAKKFNERTSAYSITKEGRNIYINTYRHTYIQAENIEMKKQKKNKNRKKHINKKRNK